MSEEYGNIFGAAPGGAVHAADDVLTALGRFDGPPEQFLRYLLRVQSESVEAEGAAILRADEKGLHVIIVHPPSQEGEHPPWLGPCVEAVPRVVKTGRGEVVPVHDPDGLYGEPARRHIAVVPVPTGAAPVAAAFLLTAPGEAELLIKRERLNLTGTFLSVYEMRLRNEQRGTDLERLRAAMEMLSVVNEQARFKAAAMAVCNELAARWQCERVGFGLLKGRYVHLKALSHTEKFSRKMKLVQDLEAAMEECLDQDVEVVLPASAEATYVSRAAGELSRRHGPTAIVSFPLREKGEPVGVLTAERRSDEPFSVADLEAMRLACDLVTPRLLDQSRRDRWFGARAASALRGGAGVLLGAKHTWAKLTAIAVLAVALFLIFAEGDYEAKAPFVLEATELRVIPAPFEGYIEDVSVEPGDLIGVDAELARLHIEELNLELSRKEAEKDRYAKEADAARDEDKHAEAKIAEAQMAKAQAEIDLIRHKRDRAVLRSPLKGKGIVLTGDLKRQIGAPVKKGDVLFEVAPVAAIRAVLSVPEDMIADVREADAKAKTHGERARGELATASQPDRHVRFELEHITPVAEVVEQKNVFKVRVKLLESTAAELSQGMEGAARITIDRRRYAWIWSRRLVNWVRMKLWF